MYLLQAEGLKTGESIVFIRHNHPFHTIILLLDMYKRHARTLEDSTGNELIIKDRGIDRRCPYHFGSLIMKNRISNVSLPSSPARSNTSPCQPFAPVVWVQNKKEVIRGAAEALGMAGSDSEQYEF